MTRGAARRQNSARACALGGRHVAYLVLGDLQAHPVGHAVYGADRHRDRSLAPEVAGVEQDVRDVAIAGVDHQFTDAPDLTVRCVHRLPAAYRHFADGYPVADDLWGTARREVET